MNNLIAVVLPYLGRILLAIAIWLVGKKLIGFIVQLTERRMDKVRVDQSLHTFLLPLVRITLQILLILTVAATVGIEITTFAAVIGGQPVSRWAWRFKAVWPTLRGGRFDFDLKTVPGG